jgi:hypothetical protein
MRSIVRYVALLAIALALGALAFFALPLLGDSGSLGHSVSQSHSLPQGNSLSQGQLRDGVGDTALAQDATGGTRPEPAGGSHGKARGGEHHGDSAKESLWAPLAKFALCFAAAALALALGKALARKARKQGPPRGEAASA